MTIDLSHYLEKVVKVTLRNDETYTGLIFCGKDPCGRNVIKFSFTYKDSVETKLNYFNNGLNYYQVSAFDIVKIEPVNLEQKQMSLNALDSKTLHTIATALIPGVINYIDSHEKYAEVMQSLIIEYVEKNLGDVNGELPFMIFDMINLNNVGR